MIVQYLPARLRQLIGHPGFRREPVRVLGRIASWAWHCAFHRPAMAYFPDFDFWLQLPPKWRGGGSTAAYLFRERYEPELPALPSLLQPGMVFVDAGANTGVFTFAAAVLVGPSGRVVSFEPGRRCFAGLERSLKRNGFPQVTLQPAALSDECGEARLYHHHGRDNSFALGGDPERECGFEIVPTVTLPSALARLGIERVDFLKLDVEGAQELVLRGCGDMLRQWRPFVLIENHAVAGRRLGLNPIDAYRLLEKLGYRFFHVGNGGSWQMVADLSSVRTVLGAPPNRSVPGDLFDAAEEATATKQTSTKAGCQSDSPDTRIADVTDARTSPSRSPDVTEQGANG